ncbi:MAG: aminopeptidase [Bdellovibrionales bacterium]|nr:aminopeptidase [Bdellovibrionales bacterium]
MKWVKSLGLILLIFSTTGCQIPYLIKNSWHQTKILKARKPITEVLNDPAITSEAKRKLILIQDAKHFAESTLKLTPTKNYSTYVDLKREYVTWVVRAAPKHALEPYTWWFPITGSVPYKGYFTKEGAVDESHSLKKKGYDTFVRGVTAYSTLGWFEDPVLNTMMDYDDYELVNLIIHETVHATLFIKSNVDFNERLATFIGNKGAQIFFETQNKGSEILKTASDRNNDNSVFSKFITSEIENLKSWYKAEGKNSSEDQRQEKFKSISQKFQKDIAPQMKSDQFQDFPQLPLNNAVLLSFQSYQVNLDLFEKLYTALGSDFSNFIHFCTKLESEGDPHKKIEDYLKMQK